MTDIIVIAVVIIIVALAAFYVWRSKRKGKKCIGCPCSDSCHGSCSANKE